MEAEKKSEKVGHTYINWVCYKGKEVYFTGMNKIIINIIIKDPILNKLP